MNNACRYCSRDAAVPVIDERIAVSDASGNKFRRYCLAYERWLPMCSAKYFRTHPEPHVLPVEIDREDGKIVPVAKYETSSDWCPVVHPSAGGASFGVTRKQNDADEDDETPTPEEELLLVLDQLIDEEIDRWEASFQELGVLKQQLIDTEQVMFRAKLFLWGKLYGLVTAVETGVFINQDKYDPPSLDQSLLLQVTWDAIDSRETDIRRVIQE